MSLCPAHKLAHPCEECAAELHGEAASDVTLPSLPQERFGQMYSNTEAAFTADQLRDYAAAAVLAERERCALICDRIEHSNYAAYRPSGTLAARDCAEGIRRGQSQNAQRQLDAGAGTDFFGG